MIGNVVEDVEDDKMAAAADGIAAAVVVGKTRVLSRLSKVDVTLAVKEVRAVKQH